MGDIHLNRLHFVQKRGIEKLYQFDLFQPPFQKEFDVICMFDVLEHLEEECQAIESIKTMLKPSSKIILTLLAHPWLWNRDDAIAGHKKRYTKAHLDEEQLLHLARTMPQSSYSDYLRRILHEKIHYSKDLAPI